MFGLSCKSFADKKKITDRWVDKLSGKTPVDVDDMLTKKGWTKSLPQAGRPQAIQHTVYTRTTKSGGVYKLDYHPGAITPQSNIHSTDYWKVYKEKNGTDVVYGRIGPKGFSNYEKIFDSPVYIDGVLKNGAI